ncbi:MAG: branched-chain amino acid ABC transporter substrate-binding protein [Burkholderiaceae bacterium]|nr:branched-chain amino acid ABC transporter substrate-binding protein [Burkholderiaceae bacterium]
MNKCLGWGLVGLWCVLGSVSAWAQPIKVAFIEVLSGTMGNVGELSGKNLQFIVDDANARGGALGRKFEVVRFDSKGSPQEALAALKLAIDQGIQIVTQGNSSAVAGALIEAIDKHNQRSPDKRVLFLNFGAVDPDLTNDKCNYWHFRFDANSDMKMAAITDAIRQDRSVKKVYLINQDYAFGHQVTRAAKEMLAAKRPDIQIVGEDLHPFGRVKDFSPYIAKMRAAGADTVISGDWGADLTLLVRAAKDARFDVNWYTYYAGAYGSAAAIGEAGIGQVKVVVEWSPNLPNAKMDAFNAAYKQRHPAAPDEFYYYRMKLMVGLLGQAIERSKSTDPAKLAQALEGMKFAGDLGEVTMRADDHQLLLPMYIPTFAKEGAPGVRLGLEGSGFGFGNAVVIPAKDITLPTSCKLVRPAG